MHGSSCCRPLSPCACTCAVPNGCPLLRLPSRRSDGKEFLQTKEDRAKLDGERLLFLGLKACLGPGACWLADWAVLACQLAGWDLSRSRCDTQPGVCSTAAAAQPAPSRTLLSWPELGAWDMLPAHPLAQACTSASCAPAAPPPAPPTGGTPTSTWAPPCCWPRTGGRMRPGHPTSMVWRWS